MTENPETIDPYKLAITAYFDSSAAMFDADLTSEEKRLACNCLLAGMLAGKNNYELAISIKAIVGDQDIVRASRLVQTEISRASTYADIEVWAASGMVKSKEWLTAKDKHVCFICESLNGNIYELRAKVKDDRPGPPLHEGCRCVLL